MFLAANENGNQFVKSVAGEPSYRATWDRKEAHQFETAEAALEWANKQFRGRGTAIEVKTATASKSVAWVNPSLARAIEKGGDAWTNRDDADEVFFGRH